jgi:type II secretory pathway component GspD/PulD (secretin)
MNRAFLRATTALAILAILGACTAPALQGSPQALADRDISARTPDSKLMRQDAVNFFAEKPVTQLQIDASQQFQLKTDIGGAVPRVAVQRLNAAPMRFPDILAQIGEQVGMSWSITGDDRDELLSREVYYVQRNETMLENVLEELSKSTNSFYRIDGDRIVFEQVRAFTTSIPRFADSQTIIRQGIESLGATNVFVDSVTGSMTFRADRRSYHAILDLMESFQSGRDMIVYDFWLIERVLRDDSAAGVEILASDGEFGVAIGGNGENIEALGIGSDDTSFQGNLGSLTVEATLRLIRALGQTETLSRPTLTMLSGSESSFRTGENIEYIRSINTPEAADDGSIPSTGTTTDVRSLETGLRIDVSGSHNAGVISTDLTIDLTDLIEFREFETEQATLQLPRTSERNIDTQLEARPGDVMILGGIIRDRQEKGQRNLGATDVPTGRIAESTKTETLVLVRPRLVQIRPTGRAAVAVPGKMSNVVGDVITDEARAAKLLADMGDGK